MRDSGIPPRPLPRPTLRRRLGLEHNELRRRVDRVQRCLALCLLALMLAVVTPLAVWGGRWTYDTGLRAERDERAERRQVVATVVATGGVGSAGDRYVHETVTATWPRPDAPNAAENTGNTAGNAKARGTRTGALPGWKGAEVGAKKRIWVTMDGEVTGQPRAHSRTVSDAGYTAASVVLIGAVPFLLAYLLLRRRCDRHRYTMWDDAWARMDAQRGRKSS
jgi:hypothetical protein